MFSSKKAAANAKISEWTYNENNNYDDDGDDNDDMIRETLLIAEVCARCFGLKKILVHQFLLMHREIL